MIRNLGILFKVIWKNMLKIKNLIETFCILCFLIDETLLYKLHLKLSSSVALTVHTDVMCIFRKLFWVSHLSSVAVIFLFYYSGATRSHTWWFRQIFNSWHSCLSLPNRITGAHDYSQLIIKSAAWFHFNKSSRAKGYYRTVIEFRLFSFKILNLLGPVLRLQTGVMTVVPQFLF